VIAEPPVAAEAVKGTETTPAVPPDAVPIVGEEGTVVAVMLDEAADVGPVADAFVPVTAKVYEVADCKPVTVTGEPAPEPVNDPGVDVAVKEVEVPPVADAVNATVAEPLLKALAVPTFVAAPIVGASGTSGIAIPLLVIPDVFALLMLAMMLLYLIPLKFLSRRLLFHPRCIVFHL